MYCAKCGKEISDDSKYCYLCGARAINFANTDVLFSPSDNVDNPKISEVKGENIDDIKKDGALSSLMTKSKYEDTPLFASILKDKVKPYQPSQRGKWGWGWIILLFIYSRSFPIGGNRDGNEYTYIIEFLGFFVMLIFYFWIRKYLGRYYDDYKPSLISGIISVFSIVFLVTFLSKLFIRF